MLFVCVWLQLLWSFIVYISVLCLADALLGLSASDGLIVGHFVSFLLNSTEDTQRKLCAQAEKCCQ